MPINANQLFNESGRADYDEYILLAVDPMIGDEIWYNSTIEYSSLSLLKYGIHNITHFANKKKEKLQSISKMISLK